MQHLTDPNANVTVVACGEKWEHPDADGCHRFAVEDYLGAGAVLQNMLLSKSPEAEVCAAAFAAIQDRLAETLWNCGSGLELRKRGYPQDVEHASMLNIYDSAPVLRHGQFELST
jgi:2-phosphosulfolactate phosphatase